MEFYAHYFDGKTSNKYEVELRFFAEEFQIMDVESPAGLPLARWPLDEVILQNYEKNYGRFHLAIKNGNEGEHLTLFGRGTEDYIEQNFPHLFTKLKRKKVLGPLAITTASIAGFVGLYYLIPAFSGLVVPLISDEFQKDLGDTLATSIAGSYCTGDEGTKALHSLSQRLQGDQQFAFPLEIRVADSPIVNAFAAPGGKIVLMRGLLEKADTPDEVAGVLAHEMGHVQGRHAIKHMVEGLGISLIFGSITGDVGSYAQMAYTINYSRKDEASADDMGLALMDKSNIKMDGFVRFFEKLQEEEKVEDDDSRLKRGLKNLGSFLSTHPSNEDRAAKAKKYSDSQTGQTPALSNEQWKALKNICKTSTDDQD